jgi:hypothetical protein
VVVDVVERGLPRAQGFLLVVLLYTASAQSLQCLRTMHTHLTLKVDCSGAGQESLVVGFLRSIRSHGRMVFCCKLRELWNAVGNRDGVVHVWLWCVVSCLGLSVSYA